MSLLYSSESPYSLTLCANGSATDCTLCIYSNVSTGSFLSTIPASEDPRIEELRTYSYAIALPAICFLGIIGNIFNLIVLTRRNMRGTAYIYMRGKKNLTYDLKYFISTYFQVLYIKHYTIYGNLLI